MFFSRTIAASLALTASALNVERATTLNYEYIVVGSGAGGGVVAARLAQAGHKTLLIEAGDDQGSNVNYTVPAYQAKSTEDPAMGWEFFVRHYSNDAQQKKDFKLTYDLTNGSTYTGLNPPAGATIKGVLYPRSAQLGGCTGHNALITIYPDQSDFQNIVDITGDTSWAPANMRKYWVKLEKNEYLPPNQPGHGYSGWLGIQTAPITLAIRDTQLYSFISGGAAALGNGTTYLSNFFNLVTADANADSVARDTTQAYYQIPIATNGYARNGVRELILNVTNAKNTDGSKKYPLDVRLNSHVTKVTFDTTKNPPKANGVQFLDGKYLYKAAILNTQAGKGTAGSASASREVIVAGGSYNSPQILKLSGVGPAAELKKFNIPVIADLPGVGTNLQDHYEVTVQGTTKSNFSVLDGCNFGFAGLGKPIPATSDPCYNTWLQQAGQASRGVYSSSGFAAGMFIKTTESPDNNYDVFGFGGPVNFRGYFPGYSYFATYQHNWFSWALLKSHPRNRAGTVLLKSANPLDVPVINFRYFNEGSGDYQADLDQIAQAIEVGRSAFADQLTNITEVLPGPNVKTKADVENYVKNTAWGHHCSCTCPIGADNDPMAVLDSSFRVRGVQGLRVVDASVYPKIPGTFTAASTYLVGEKAADVILSQLQ